MVSQSLPYVNYCFCLVFCLLLLNPPWEIDGACFSCFFLISFLFELSFFLFFSLLLVGQLSWCATVARYLIRSHSVFLVLLLPSRYRLDTIN